jgi:hypothetical protein
VHELNLKISFSLKQNAGFILQQCACIFEIVVQEESALKS